MLNMLPSHCFQFDFLNDDFDTLPSDLQNIINDDEKRKKLIIYINPPYAEAGNKRTMAGTGANKSGVSMQKMREKYQEEMGKATNELFAQFFARIIFELPNCKMASFGKMKYVNSPNFVKFREYFKSTYKKGFIVPASSFDNVTGQFPIGFLIWDLGIQKPIKKIFVDVYDVKIKVKKDNIFKEIKEITQIGKKKYYSYDGMNYINDWVNEHKASNELGYFSNGKRGNDFHHNNRVYIGHTMHKSETLSGIDKQSLIYMCIYFSVRHCKPTTWLNNSDQFLYPNDTYKKDKEFHNDCLTFALFHSKNRISSKDGTNHWIPFKESEVNAQGLFDSNFMVDFINGKIELQANGLYEEDGFTPKREFSKEATDVFNAGRALWKYYHTADFTMSDDKYNVNASLYDIRKHFQGESKSGRMNSKSNDTRYNELMNALREAMQILAEKIEKKVYEYGFLLE
jgi:hypothetical protein